MSVRTRIALLFAAGLALAQQPIRVDVSLINVGFTVRDARGALATGLTKDDFEVLEDGLAQKISFFARGSDVPLALGLVVDVSGSQEHFLEPHHRDLETFLAEVMDPHDQAFLLCFGNHLRLASDFTSEPPALLNGLRRFEKGDRNFPELAKDGTRELGTAFYDAIYHSVKQRLAQSGAARRALVLFSDGEDNSSAWNMLDTIEAAQSEDVRIYALRYTDTKGNRRSARNHYGTRVMDRLARETGGAHYDARQGELRTWFRQIGEELRATYELAYHSSAPDRDNTFRKVVIRTKQPGLTVRAKTGYYARP